MKVKMFNDNELKEQLKRVLSAVEQLLPPLVEELNWQHTWAASWRRQSLAGFLHPVDALDPIQLDELLGIEQQKLLLEENTRQFVQGFPANNVLLWGTRGTGKSSLVRALLNTYADQGLRVIQVDKDDLSYLPDILPPSKGRSIASFYCATTSLSKRVKPVTRCLRARSMARFTPPLKMCGFMSPVIDVTCCPNTKPTIWVSKWSTTNCMPVKE